MLPPENCQQTKPLEKFKFHNMFSEETNNGLYFSNVYFPEEVVIMILSYLDPKEILKVSLVCKKWCNIIKSEPFWFAIYTRNYKKKPKKLPWYVYYCLFSTNYFDTNLIKNGNGQNKYDYWKIVRNGGDQFKIEDPPCGADPLPLDIPEFYGYTSCFATSYGRCNKLQEISIEKNELLQYILDEYKPDIYVSEWMSGRFDCGCVYTLWCKLYGKKLEKEEICDDVCTNSEESWEDVSDTDDLFEYEDVLENENEALHVQETRTKIEQWAGKEWSKLEMVVKNYPKGVDKIVFQHEGKDTQFWAGHYGSKMAGGVLKILFDSISGHS